MRTRPAIMVAALLGALGSLGAGYRTQNFVVEAPTPEIAKKIGDAAEFYRKEKAQVWIGQEMPPWPKPCPLKVTVTMNGSGGATSFAFDNGRILHQDMRIEGTLDRLLASVLPHEVTHTVFAHYFRTPVPRWADEGGSVLSEDDIERARHDQLVRQILATPGRAIPLRRLFALTQYPRDVMVLYAEGFSVTNFLVARSNRQAFLTFIALGMRGDWDQAVKTHYGFGSVEELEQAWLKSLREPRRPEAALASARPPATQTAAIPTSRVSTRQTLPPSLPVLGAPRPLVRGVSGDGDDQPSGLTPGAPFNPPPGETSWANPVPAPATGFPAPPAAQPAGSAMVTPTATLGRPVPLPPGFTP